MIFAIALAVPTFFFAQETSKDKKCDLSADLKEPKPEKSIQSKLKRGDATYEDLRKHIAIENVVDMMFRNQRLLSDTKFASF